MKKITLLSLLTISVSCKQNEKKEALYPETETVQTPVQRGQELFDGAGNCFACHKPDQKVIGPSIQEIAKIYNEKNGDIVAFLKEKADPIVDPDLYETMKTNLAITKKMPEEDLKAIEAYMYSHLE